MLESDKERGNRKRGRERGRERDREKGRKKREKGFNSVKRKSCSDPHSSRLSLTWQCAH